MNRLSAFVQTKTDPDQRTFLESQTTDNQIIGDIQLDEIKVWQLSDIIQTRLILAECATIEDSLLGISPSVIAGWSRVADFGVILEFWDLREAIEVYDKFTMTGRVSRFCCPSILGSKGVVQSSSLAITLKSNDASLISESSIGDLQCFLQSLSICMISNVIYQNNRNQGQVKLFVEYLDVRVLPDICNALRNIGSEFAFHINWAPCNLWLNDRQILFTITMVEECPSRLPGRCSIDYSSEDHHGFDIDFLRIEAGLDERTTCMIRNIPNKYTQSMLIEMINETHYGAFDFIYLRMDFKNRCNVGYAFINFIDPKSIINFGRRAMGKRWPKFNSDKICHLTYARIQGKEALLDKFRHSKYIKVRLLKSSIYRVMMEPASYRPKVYYSDHDRRGVEEPFPC